MRLADFEGDGPPDGRRGPPEFLEGIAEITVSPRTVPHPARSDIFTLGECIPLPDGAGGGPDAVQSRVVLYHGSFAALARVNGGFDWREEAWETLTHELRHHLEWRARAPDLEELDWAVETELRPAGRGGVRPDLLPPGGAGLGRTLAGGGRSLPGSAWSSSRGIWRR